MDLNTEGRVGSQRPGETNQGKAGKHKPGSQNQKLEATTWEHDTLTWVGSGGEDTFLYKKTLWRNLLCIVHNIVYTENFDMQPVFKAGIFAAQAGGTDWQVRISNFFKLLPFFLQGSFSDLSWSKFHEKIFCIMKTLRRPETLWGLSVAQRC